MNITSAQKLSVTKNGILIEDKALLVVIDGVEMTVPTDPANRHYAEILRQVAAETLTIAPAEED